jgi:hypothetical protein
MIDKNYLKAISCFNFEEYENNPKKIIEFKVNDNLDYCRITPCQYFTLVPETAQTILNTPWGAKPFPFSMEVLKPTDNAGNIIQIISIGGEWRRRQFNNSLETWWREWINIENIIDFIRNAGENIRKNISANWNKYILIDENNHKNRRWEGNSITIDEIIDEIKTGTAKIYRNKFVKK